MNERAIFEKAVEIQNPAQRQAFLAQVCGQDSALRARVEALLKSHEAAGSFLGIPAVEQVQPGAAQPLQATQDLGLQADAEPESSAEEACRAVLGLLQPSTKPDSLGVLGHYEVLEVLGQGGFGIVLKAFDETLHRLVAIKMMTPQMAATSPPRKRFLREARAVAAMRNENIVQVYSVEEQPLPYLVMEYIAGETLQKKMDQAGPLETGEILHIGRQIASGLAAAHGTGMIHRDIKPGNILLEQGAEQRVKITDFGLARATDDASMTRSGAVSGTPMYMAPEQASGQALDQRTDLFSLGSVLYQMACGRPPFRASNTLAVLRRVAEDAPRPLQEILPEVPGFLVAIIAKLHAKQPADRFQSAKELADLLSRCQAELQSGGKVNLIQPQSIPETSVSTPTQPATEPASKQGIDKSHGANNRGLAIAASLLLALAAAFVFTEATGVTNWIRREGNSIPSPSPSDTGPLATKADSDRELPQGVIEPKSSSSPDRQVVELALRRGGKMRVVAKGETDFKPVADVDDLPTGDFRLIWLSFNNAKEGPRVTDEFMARLSGLEELAYLDLIGTSVTDAGLSHLAGMKSLRELSLASTRISDAGLAHLKGLNLDSIGLTQTGVTDAGLAHLQGMSSLREARLSYTKVTDSGMPYLSKLPDLKWIALTHTPVTGAGLAHFKGLNKLIRLSLGGTQLSDDGLLHLIDLPALFQLDLHGEMVTDDVLIHVKALPGLTHLGLAESTVTDAGLRHVAECSKLSDLQLNLIRARVTIAGLSSLQRLPNLRTLSVIHTDVPESDLNRLAELMPRCTITRDGRVIEKRARPFVVTRPDGTQRGEYAFLWEAIRFLEDGGVITVFGNGPFEVGKVVLNGSLRLRAAPGYRPRFVPTSTVNPLDPWFHINGGLDIAGCDFETPIYFMMFEGGGSKPWQFDNCRILGHFKRWVSFSGPRLTVTDCRIDRASWGAESLIDAYRGIGQIDIRNNVVRAHDCHIINVAPEASRINISLTSNTFGAGRVLAVDERNPNTLVLHAAGNVFHGVGWQIDGQQTPAEQRDKHSWIGVDNVYTGFVHRSAGQAFARAEDDSLEVERVTFQFETRLDTDSAGVPSLALKSDLDRLRQKHQLPNLGPELDLIGPGEAYVRALEQASGKPIPEDQLRPSPTADGPFVVLREDKVLRGHLTLRQAMAEVQDGDVIEIRGDGPYQVDHGDNYTAKPGTRLTIRSGLGYWPVLEGQLRFATGFEVTIEGIHLRNLNDSWRGLETVGGAVQVAQEGHITRLANCWFESKHPECTYVWCHTPDGEPAEIVNCWMSGITHVAIASQRKLVVRNCAIGPIYVTRTDDGGEASLDLERTALLNPALRRSQGEAIYVAGGRGALAISSSDCLFETGPYATHRINEEVKLAWSGMRNVYRREGGALIPQLRELFQSAEENSVDEEPIHYDPQAWRLVAGTPGQGTLPGGRDVGANVDRVARPTLATSAPLTSEARKGLEWVLSAGGRVRFYGDDLSKMYRQGDALPKGPVALFDLASENPDLVNDTTIENLRHVLFVRHDGLTAINLPNTSITDGGIARLASYPGLAGIKCLSLSNTGISDAGLGHVSRFRDLQSLSLIDTSISDAGLASLRGLPLHNLRLDGCKAINGSGLTQLRHLPALRELNVAGCSISDDKLAALRGLPLTFLEVKNVGDAGLEHLVELPKLQTLRLLYCGITDEGLARLQNSPTFVAYRSAPVRISPMPAWST